MSAWNRISFALGGALGVGLLVEYARTGDGLQLFFAIVVLSTSLNAVSCTVWPEATS